MGPDVRSRREDVVYRYGDTKEKRKKKIGAMCRDDDQRPREIAPPLPRTQNRNSQLDPVNLSNVRFVFRAPKLTAS